jgi:hypothetical protein
VQKIDLDEQLNMESLLYNSQLMQMTRPNANAQPQKLKELRERITSLEMIKSSLRESIIFETNQNEAALRASSMKVVPQEQPKKTEYRFTVPRFNLKNSNYINKYYQAESNVDKNNNTIAYDTVEHFIEAFEHTMLTYNTEIEQHWHRAMGITFSASDDQEPKEWWEYEIKANGKNIYINWDAFKQRLIQKYMESLSQYDYTVILRSLNQETGGNLMRYTRKYIYIMHKCNVPDDRRMAINWYLSLQKYTQDYLKRKFAEIKTTTIKVTEPILPTDTLRSLLQVLEPHQSVINADLWTISEEEKKRRQVQTMSKHVESSKKRSSHSMSDQQGRHTNS